MAKHKGNNHKSHSHGNGEKPLSEYTPEEQAFLVREGIVSPNDPRLRGKNSGNNIHPHEEGMLGKNKGGIIGMVLGVMLAMMFGAENPLMMLLLPLIIGGIGSITGDKDGFLNNMLHGGDKGKDVDPQQGNGLVKSHAIAPNNERAQEEALKHAKGFHKVSGGHNVTHHDIAASNVPYGHSAHRQV